MNEETARTLKNLADRLRQLSEEHLQEADAQKKKGNPFAEANELVKSNVYMEISSAFLAEIVGV